MDHTVNRFMAFLPIFIGLSGTFSVLFGAWLAHASGHLSISDVNRVSKAHLYQFLHTIVLLIIWLAYQHRAKLILGVSASAITLGIICFSGSLYIKTFFGFSAISSIAPVGGVSLALGWILLIFLGKR